MSFLCALKVDLYADTSKSAYVYFISRHFIQKLASGRLSPSGSWTREGTWEPPVGDSAGQRHLAVHCGDWLLGSQAATPG